MLVSQCFETFERSAPFVDIVRKLVENGEVCNKTDSA